MEGNLLNSKKKTKYKETHVSKKKLVRRPLRPFLHFFYYRHIVPIRTIQCLIYKKDECSTVYCTVLYTVLLLYYYYYCTTFVH